MPDIPPQRRGPRHSQKRGLVAAGTTASALFNANYFEEAACDTIGNGMMLLTAIRECQVAHDFPEEGRIVANFCLLCEILSSLRSYRQFMLRVGAATVVQEVAFVEEEKQPDGTATKVRKMKRVLPQPTLRSPQIDEMRLAIETAYWGSAEETQKGIMVAVRNALTPFLRRIEPADARERVRLALQFMQRRRNPLSASGRLRHPEMALIRAFVRTRCLRLKTVRERDLAPLVHFLAIEAPAA